METPYDDPITEVTTGMKGYQQGGTVSLMLIVS